jgi:hypothetical protein
MKPTKKQLERALELACDTSLKLAYRDTQMTMYGGKWEEMIERQKAHFIKIAKQKEKN